MKKKKKEIRKDNHILWISAVSLLSRVSWEMKLRTGSFRVSD